MEGGDEVLESIYDALDGGDPESALRRARQTIAREGEEPVLCFLSGVALMDLDRPEEAAEAFESAVRLDPDDTEFRTQLAMALFKSCRFEEAAPHAVAALDADPGFPDAHVASALVLERQGRFTEADRHFIEAARLDPQTFPAPVRCDAGTFEQEVQEAGERLPADFRRHLADVVVTVEDLPSNDVLLDVHPPLDPELLGLFVGTSLPERSFAAAGADLPPRILLFRRNLERFAADPQALRDELQRTLYHELAHYLGFEEEQMSGMDLD